MSCGVLKETITEFENALESRTEDIADKVACLSYFEYGMQILDVITGRKYHPDFLWRYATLLKHLKKRCLLIIYRTKKEAYGGQFKS